MTEKWEQQCTTDMMNIWIFMETCILLIVEEGISRPFYLLAGWIGWLASIGKNCSHGPEIIISEHFWNLFFLGHPIDLSICWPCGLVCWQVAAQMTSHHFTAWRACWSIHPRVSWPQWWSSLWCWCWCRQHCPVAVVDVLGEFDKYREGFGGIPRADVESLMSLSA